MFEHMAVQEPFSWIIRDKGDARNLLRADKECIAPNVAFIDRAAAPFHNAEMMAKARRFAPQ